MQYEHTQRGLVHALVYLTAGIMLFAGWFCRGEPVLAIILAATGAALVPLGMCFHWLTVRDEGDHLDVRFGPLPLFGIRIRYDEITGVHPGRSSLLDGWGVHWMPGKGWIYNIWGFDCVSVVLNHKTIRIGTDDLVNLLVFLRNKKAPADTP